MGHFVRISLPIGAGSSFSSDGSHANDASCTLRGEHFQQYGEGHYLTYFRGNENIPLLGLGEDWLQKLASLTCVNTELAVSRSKRGRTLTDLVRWRLTFNEYPVQHKSKTVRHG